MKKSNTAKKSNQPAKGSKNVSKKKETKNIEPQTGSVLTQMEETSPIVPQVGVAVEVLDSGEIETQTAPETQENSPENNSENVSENNPETNENESQQENPEKSEQTEEKLVIPPVEKKIFDINSFINIIPQKVKCGVLMVQLKTPSVGTMKTSKILTENSQKITDAQTSLIKLFKTKVDGKLKSDQVVVELIAAKNAIVKLLAVNTIEIKSFKNVNLITIDKYQSFVDQFNVLNEALNIAIHNFCKKLPELKKQDKENLTNQLTGQTAYDENAYKTVEEYKKVLQVNLSEMVLSHGENVSPANYSVILEAHKNTKERLRNTIHECVTAMENVYSGAGSSFKVSSLKNILSEIENQPSFIEDEEFDKLKKELSEIVTLITNKLSSLRLKESDKQNNPTIYDDNKRNLAVIIGELKKPIDQLDADMSAFA